MRAVLTMWKLELVRARNAPLLVIATLLTPLTWLVLFGALFDQGTGLSFQRVRYFTFVAPGLAVMSAMFFALTSGAQTMADRQVGFLKEVLVAPVPRAQVILGRTLGICTLVAAQAFILLGIPLLAGQGAPFPGGVLAIAGVVAALGLVALAFTGLGMMMGAKGNNPQSLQGGIGLLTLPMFFLSGALLPVSNLPGWAHVIALVNPLAYAVDAVRQAALGAQVASFPLALDFLGLAGFALLTLSAGARQLNRQ